MKKKILLFISLCLIPSFVFASSNSADIPLIIALFMEAFVSIHMTLFVLIPLSNIFGGDNPKALLKILFVGRVLILMFFNLFITTNIAVVDFMAVFVGAFLVIPISSVISKKEPYGSTLIPSSNPTRNVNLNKNIGGIVLKCSSCDTEVTVEHKFCPKCGSSLTGNNIKVEQSLTGNIQVPNKISVTPNDFDNMYSLPEDKMLEEFLERELSKHAINPTSKLIPSAILKRKKIMNAIFILLMFVYVSMIFFHFPIATYSIGAVVLIIYFFVSRNYNLMKYLKKEVKARPSEKVSNIVMTVKSTFVKDNSRLPFFAGLCLSIALPLIIFWNPRILYEKVENGYAVRFYIFGVTNFQTATIPDTYKGENIVALRGNTFSNMPFLEEVKLPDTVVEIRGQAFKNDKRLAKVNIPSKLEYLGGGAFYNCSSIEEIELPDTLEYLGGEAFYGATSLRKVKLSNKLTEIRGSTFENCTSLEAISIPDTVTRIGGHAFYGDYSLELVEVSPKSQLVEIGSSAFRQCDSLYDIKLPIGVQINERAFKESPTDISYYRAESFKVNGAGKNIEVEHHGTMFFNIYGAYMLDNKVHATLKVYGSRIQENFDLTFDGSKYYISDYLYVTTEEYDNIQDYFEIYISDY